jgi:hypothetical protein
MVTTPLQRPGVSEEEEDKRIARWGTPFRGLGGVREGDTNVPG